MISVDVDEIDDFINIEGDDDEMKDFMIAYNDLDANAAEDMLKKYSCNKITEKTEYTPELALQKINAHIIKTGKFKDYDLMYEALYNAIHGI